jgi:hypothetical protein
MATYDECLIAMEHPSLFNKVRVAVLVAADVVRSEAAGTANHAARLAWARRVMESPDAEARKMIGMAVVQNRASTLVQITGAADAAVQAAVNNAIDVLAQ